MKQPPSISRLVSTLALPLALAACSAPRPPEEPPMAPPPAPSAVSAAPQPTADTKPPSDPRLGQACRKPTGLDERCVLCDEGDKIAGVVMMGDAVHFDAAAVFRRSAEASGPRDLVFTFAADAQTLWAQVLSCPGCRRQMGWSVVLSTAALPRMSQGLRAELQTALGYPATPLLDAEGFKTAPAQAPSRDSLACKEGIRR